jgi:RND family efflux transporter MFP subunit
MRKQGVVLGLLAAVVGGWIVWSGGIDPARQKLVQVSSELLDGKSRAPTVSKTGAAPIGQQKGVPGQPPAVTTSKPVQRSIVEWDEYTGRFDAVESVDVRARVSGYLMEVHFKDGAFVKKGDLLYTIDARPFERAYDQANAELAQAKTKVENASLDVDRGKPLVERKIMSEKVFDDRANALRDAQATLKVAEAKVRTTELDLFFTKITAPISGRLSRSGISAGGWVSAGALGNASLLTSIVSESPIHIYIDVSENNWIKYRRLIEAGQKSGGAQLGSQVEIALPDEKGFPHKGTIDFVDNRLDQATGTLRARALVDNPVGTFSPGMFARVRVAATPNYDALLLPDEAIGTDQTNKFVLTVASDGTVGRKSVVLGPIVDGLRVIRSGLTVADTVIVKGLQRARPGAKVAPKLEQVRGTAAAAPVVPAASKDAGGKEPTTAAEAAGSNSTAIRRQ